MSERGSFVTEYFYCETCFESLREVLINTDKYFCSQQLDGWLKDKLPIIAGKVGGLWSGEEVFVFDHIMRVQIERAICHSVTIAVLCDSIDKSEILSFNPR